MGPSIGKGREGGEGEVRAGWWQRATEVREAAAKPLDVASILPAVESFPSLSYPLSILQYKQLLTRRELHLPSLSLALPAPPFPFKPPPTHQLYVLLALHVSSHLQTSNHILSLPSSYPCVSSFPLKLPYPLYYLGSHTYSRFTSLEETNTPRS